MLNCPECDEEIDEEDTLWECPFCGYEDYGEGFYQCFNCDTLFDYNEDLWVCENCNNEGIKEQPKRYYAYYDDECEDDEYCEDGIPDVNQGWVGEHYG